MIYLNPISGPTHEIFYACTFIQNQDFFKIVVSFGNGDFSPSSHFSSLNSRIIVTILYYLQSLLQVTKYIKHWFVVFKGVFSSKLHVIGYEGKINFHVLQHVGVIKVLIDSENDVAYYFLLLIIWHGDCMISWYIIITLTVLYPLCCIHYPIREAVHKHGCQPC